MRLTDGTAEAFAPAAPLGDEGRVHPFDDPVVVAVQGAVARELARDADDLTGVLVGVIAPAHHQSAPSPGSDPLHYPPDGRQETPGGGLRLLGGAIRAALRSPRLG
ncbi:hypothetical protein GCM10017776_13580 [Streptomyces griseoluteus]|nr:hypothetical protein GCM10017776_13580 [Streptomyces griseoluteus]